MITRRTFLFIMVAAGLIGASAALMLVMQDRQPIVRTTGVAKIGGPFTLVNHHGETVTEKTYLGKFMLVYFGYTYCPDVCPSELGIISQALDSLGDRAGKITPVFISVDPARDTVAQMAEYVGNFHKNFVGLTGTEAQVKKAARAYRVYFARGKDDGASENYVMDHSSIIYVMRPDGKLATFFPYGTKPDAMAEKLAKLLGE